MADNFLNAAGSFGEGFLSTLQSERDRKQKELEFQQRMDFENRQLRLLDIYRNNSLIQDQTQFQQKLGQDQSQFDTGMNFKEKELSEDIRQFDLGQKFKQSEADRDYEIDKGQIGLGYSNLAQRKKEFEYEKENKTQNRSEVDQRQIDELFGKAQGYLSENRAGVEEEKYSNWKLDANTTVGQLLERVGVPINGEVTNYLRSVLEDSDDPETKRNLLNEAINEVYSQGAITDEQKRALQLWKELGTR